MYVRRDRYPPIFLLGMLVPVYAWSTQETTISEEDLLADVAQIEQEIALAEEDVARFEEGSIKVLYDYRLAVLTLSKALLDQRVKALRAGVPVDASLTVTEPNPERLSEILSDMEKAQRKLAAAESDAAQAPSGLPKALADNQVATARQILATLQLAYYRDRYGLHFEPTAQQPSSGGNGKQQEAIAGGEQGGVATDIAWADSRYPDIDYSKPAFQALAQQDSIISGWWGIRKSKAEIDDSPTVHAFNVSATEGARFEPHLSVICQEGETKLLFQPGDLLVDEDGNLEAEIRIDADAAQTMSWNATTHNKSAGLFGERAEAFLKDIKGAKTLYVRLTERYGERHDAKFILSGFQKVIEGVAEACQWSTLVKSDIEAVQSALKSLGYYKGTVDGSWGKGSQQALNAWQEARGIPITQALTAKTARTLVGEK
jgi:hypothetical protein